MRYLIPKEAVLLEHREGVSPPAGLYRPLGEQFAHEKDVYRLSMEEKLGISAGVGGSGGKLTPADTATRAQMAQVLYSLLSK